MKLEILKDTQKLLLAVYGDLAQPSVQKVGKALGTVFEFTTSIFLPLQLQNEKWKLNFKKRLEEYKDKIQDIPDQKMLEVNPQVGSPILNKLSYTTNDEIAELFINILKKASSIDTVNLAHPSFVQLVERLSVDEARIINYLNKDKKGFIPYVNLRITRKESKGYKEIISGATLIEKEVDLSFPKNLNTYIGNLISMGILTDMEGTYKVDGSLYKPIFKKLNYEKLNAKLSKEIKDFKSLDKSKSYYKITDFGKSFIKACTK